MSFFNINENNISIKEKLTYLYSGVSINHPDITTLTIDDNKNSIKKKIYQRLKAREYKKRILFIKLN